MKDLLKKAVGALLQEWIPAGTSLLIKLFLYYF